jgi:cell division protein FtsB
MSFGREVKRRCKAAIAPLVFMGLTGYFAWSAIHGDHGLQSFAYRAGQLRDAQADQASAQTDLDLWERRVAGLRTNRLDPDMLDQQARATLNLADPADVVVMYGPGKKLF